MDSEPSDTPFNNDRQFFDGLDNELQDEIVERDQRTFMESISYRSNMIGEIIDDPESSQLLIDLKDAHDASEEDFARYIKSLFDVPMSDELRHIFIKSAFIDTDYSQKALNEITYGEESGYNIDELDESIAELLEYEEDVAEEEIIQKFRREFGEDIIELLDRLYPEEAGFWTADRRRLDEQLREVGLISIIDKFLAVQHSRLDAIETYEVGINEIHEIHHRMIDIFEACVEQVQIMEDATSDERIDLITGLFTITDETQNELFTRTDDQDKRTPEDISKIRQQIEELCKGTSNKTARTRIAWLYRKEFTADLTILLDKYGRTDR